jgi:outer membrane protein
MKNYLLKTCLILFLFCITITSQAQIEKGMKVLTVNSSYDYTHWGSNNSGIEYKSNTFSVSPQIGFLINNKFCIGTSVSFFNYSRNENNGGFPSSSFKSNILSYGLAPYARYYKSISDKFYCFANASVGFGFNNAMSRNSSGFVNRGSGYYYSSGLNFGLLYFISSKLALETSLAGINYNHSSNEGALYNNFNKSTELTARLMPMGLSLGVSYYFR